jgi:STAS-like domain of unknown function (DUF4325)
MKRKITTPRSDSATIRIADYAGTFAEDKDAAKLLRQEILDQLAKSDDEIVLDFENVESSTQSFIHALISKALLDNGEAVLERIQFLHCSEKVKKLVTMVTNYSLE